MLCWVFGTVCPLLWISQHLTLLSHEPAIRKVEAVTDGGENLRHEIESSGGFITSKSFMGLGVVPKLLLALLFEPNGILEVPKALLAKSAMGEKRAFQKRF